MFSRTNTRTYSSYSFQLTEKATSSFDVLQQTYWISCLQTIRLFLTIFTSHLLFLRDNWYLKSSFFYRVSIKYSLLSNSFWFVYFIFRGGSPIFSIKSLTKKSNNYWTTCFYEIIMTEKIKPDMQKTNPHEVHFLR